METWLDKPKTATEAIEIPSKSNNLTCAIALESLPRLVQLEYPGFVENPSNAVRTLGGIHKLSQILSHGKKKVEVRFRPGDIYCKPAYGQPMVTCGLLIKIRRKKCAAPDPPKSPVPLILTELSHLPDIDRDREAPTVVPIATSLLAGSADLDSRYRIVEQADKQQIIVFDGPCPDLLRDNLDQQAKYHKDQEEAAELEATNKAKRYEIGQTMLEEEKKFLEDMTLKKRFQRCSNEDSKFSKDVGAAFKKNRIYLKVPQNLSDIRAERSSFDIEVLGIIPRTYKFGGMCDFQYLPVKRMKRRHVSIMHKILPAFGDPDAPHSSVEDLIVCRLATEGHDAQIPLFLVPNVMSRVDKPIDDLVNFLEGGLAKDIVYNRQPHTVSTTRAKRIIYSHLCNFRTTDDNLDTTDCLVPSGPMEQAIEGATKRALMGDQLTLVKNLFDKRPVYTKIQIEDECGIGIFALKYLLPVVAYFALNGPWRSCWIRYGYDPRKDRFSYKFQLLDYRVPNPYRTLMERRRHSTIEVDRECLYRFQPNMVPPKCQMIYQVCEIKIKEVDDLIQILESRITENPNRKFDPRFGFLTEDALEYCRYCISRTTETYLFNQGKIPGMTLPEVELPELDEGELTFKSGPWISSRLGSSYVKKPAGEKRKLRSRTRAQFDQEEMSNQSNVADLKIRPHFSKDQDDSNDGSDSEDQDEDERIMQEALDATTLEELDDDEEEQEINPEDLDPDQILGLE